MPFKKRANTEAQPILSGRRNNTLKEASDDQIYAIAGLLATTLAQGNAIYVTPGRFGGIQYKVYVEGDQFAEYLEVNGQTEDLVESVLEALYDLDTVAWFRKRFGAGRAEQPQEARKGSEATPDTAKRQRGP